MNSITLLNNQNEIFSVNFSDNTDNNLHRNIYNSSDLTYNANNKTLTSSKIISDNITLNTITGDNTSGVIHGNLSGNVITNQPNITTW